MDSEKYLKLEHAIEHGESPSNEGPFYHHSWWEAYKGSIKGKLGGTVIGGLMGLAVGTLAAASLAAFTAAAPVVIGGTFLGLMGAGILYGVVEFSEIGKIVGAQAATQEQADAREAIRFSVLEKKIDALTNIVRGKEADAKTEPLVDTSRENEALDTYRKTHYARLNGSTKGLIFWKIALVGLAVGMAAGAVLGMSGIAAHIFGDFVAGGGVTTAVSMLTFGAFGASFGINRDYFRKAFDVTDLWTKGVFKSKKVEQLQNEAGKKFEKEHNLPIHDEPMPAIATAITADNDPDYPRSSTFHRDRVVASKNLLDFDHTRATPH